MAALNLATLSAIPCVCADLFIASIKHYSNSALDLPSTYVTGPAKIDHVSANKSPIFSVFAVS